MPARHALVRRPSPRLAEGLITHIDRSDDVNVALAQRQWDGYVEALRGAGWTMHEVVAAPECPDSVFVEDTMVVYGDLAVIARPGADERRRETAEAESAVRAQGYRYKPSSFARRECSAVSSTGLEGHLGHPRDRAKGLLHLLISIRSRSRNGSCGSTVFVVP